MSTIFDRQNDETALTFLKAASFCNRQRLIITYYMIIVSLVITLVSIGLRIAVRYFPTISEVYSQAVVLISGLVLIGNILCSFLEYEFNIMSVNLLERYDIYVFGLPTNKAMLRPIPEQRIILYARKFNKNKVSGLKNYYFKTPEEAEQKNICFQHVKKNFEYSHRLLLSVFGFFAVLWVGYAVMIFMIAVFLSAKDTFISTLINIFVPALSTISLIASAWRHFNEQSRRLSNSVNVTTELHNSSFSKEGATSLQAPDIIRGLHDVKFNLRVNEFTIPLFLVKRFDKKLKAEEEPPKTYIEETPLKKTTPEKPRSTKPKETESVQKIKETESVQKHKETENIQKPKETEKANEKETASKECAAVTDKSQKTAATTKNNPKPAAKPANKTTDSAKPQNNQDKTAPQQKQSDQTTKPPTKPAAQTKTDPKTKKQ